MPESIHLKAVALLSGFLLAGSLNAQPRELMVTAGGGSQPDASQHNRSAGLDFSFYQYERSPNQHLQIGFSYTQIRTSADQHDNLWAVTIYPQLSLYPDADGRFRSALPEWASPYFFVRALGPSYLSEKQMGEREQGKHFAFQAQVGLGLKLNFDGKRTWIVSLSYKHFSNAGLFSPNDGMDVPLVLSLGLQF